MEFKIVDCKGFEIKVGTQVTFGFDPTNNSAVVTHISDPDGDYDDDLMRGVEIPPRVTIEYLDKAIDVIPTRNITPIGWQDYPDGPDNLVYEAGDDIEVANQLHRPGTRDYD